MSSEILVPFGKYKDKTVDLLLSDKQYMEWLNQQPWFKEKYITIYNIVSGIQEPIETPEHNKIQGMFLDKKFLLNFLVHSMNLNKDKPWKFTGRNVFEGGSPPIDVSIEGCISCEDVDQEIPFRDDPLRYNDIIRWVDSRVEIKPTVGDDCLEVLRQMKRSRSNTLLVGDYTGVGLTPNRFVELFVNENIKVIYLTDVLKSMEVLPCT
jgi:hypothetical protein